MFLIILFYTFEIYSAWSCLLIMLPNVFYLIDWFLYCQHYIWFIFRVSVFLLSFSSCLWISPPSYWPYHVLCNFLAYVLMWFSCFVHLLIWVLTIFIQPFFKGGGPENIPWHFSCLIIFGVHYWGVVTLQGCPSVCLSCISVFIHVHCASEVKDVSLNFYFSLMFYVRWVLLMSWLHLVYVPHGNLEKCLHYHT